MPRARDSRAFLEFDVLEPRRLLSGDHPSLSDFPLATAVALNLVGSDYRSSGEVSGEIGVFGDNDLFAFTVPGEYTRGSVTVAQRVVGGLAPALRIFNADGTPFNAPIDGANGLASTGGPVAFISGETYYVNVRAGTPSDANEPASTGAYALVILMADTEREQVASPGTPLPGAELISLAREDGHGSAMGILNTGNAEDQYFFEAAWNGPVDVILASTEGPMECQIVLLNEDGEVLQTADTLHDTARISVNASYPGERFYLIVRGLVLVPVGSPNGWYMLTVDAEPAPVEPPPPPPPSGAPPQDPPSDNDFLLAPHFDLRSTDGTGSIDGAITEVDGDAIFRFTSRSSRQITVSLERTLGSSFQGAIRIYNESNTQIAFSSTTSPGRLASVTLPSVLNANYYVRVEQFGGVTTLGEFCVRVASDPAEHVLYYPEGYSSSRIDEYVPLVNPNNVAVSYTIIAHYEVGERDQVIASGTLAPVTRGGITINSARAPGQSLVRLDTPYALEVRSSAPIGATFSHYDFGTTTGESFTSDLSTSWTFAQLRKDSERYRDFLIYYNPNPSPATVRFVVTYDDGEQASFVRVVGGQRRAGINVDADPIIARGGIFSVQMESDLPIVAAVSSYGLNGLGGYGLLGDSQGGSQRGALPVFRSTGATSGGLSLFNPSAQTATVTLIFTNINAQADTVRTVTIPARSRRTFTTTDFSLPGGGALGLRYESDVPITMTATERQYGDADATGSGATAANTLLIGDAFINPALAGVLYQESLTIYNPSSTPANISIRFILPGGTLGTTQISVGARSFGSVDVDQLSLIQLLRDPSVLAIRIDSSTPIIAAFMHYDLFLQGGWSAVASPLGLPTGLGGF